MDLKLRFNSSSLISVATINACSAAPIIPGTTRVVDTKYAYVEYSTPTGEHFPDYSIVKRFYCPCSVSWDTLMEDTLFGNVL